MGEKVVLQACNFKFFGLLPLSSSLEPVAILRVAALCLPVDDESLLLVSAGVRPSVRLEAFLFGSLLDRQDALHLHASSIRKHEFNMKEGCEKARRQLSFLYLLMFSALMF